MSFLQSEKRSAYLKQVRDNCQSKLAAALQKTKWTPLEDTHVTTKYALLCKCQCGMEKRVRVRDILAGKSISCRACASKERMSRLSFTERSERALKASMAAKAKAVRQAESNDATTIKELRATRSIMHGARRRCTNKNDMSYANYGGRGIKFLFPSAAAAADWALNNLGPRPKDKSIDRIDNDGHYEPGNLRWATRQEQNRNKRAYKGKAYGRRMANLLQQRQDYTYEGLRKFVKLGWSDEQILNHRKGSHTC